MVVCFLVGSEFILKKKKTAKAAVNMIWIVAEMFNI